MQQRRPARVLTPQPGLGYRYIRRKEPEGSHLPFPPSEVASPRGRGDLGAVRVPPNRRPFLGNEGGPIVRTPRTERLVLQSRSDIPRNDLRSAPPAAKLIWKIVQCATTNYSRQGFERSGVIGALFF